MFTNITEVINLRRLGRLTCSSRVLQQFQDQSSATENSGDRSLTFTQKYAISAISGLYTQVDIDPSFMQPYSPLPSDVSEHDHMKESLQRYRNHKTRSGAGKEGLG